MEAQKKISEKTNNSDIKNFQDNYKKLSHCPYCSSKIVKRGIRKKKFEQVQIYYCKYCNKRFSSIITKNKTYPLRIIIDCLTLYNKLYTLKEISEQIKENYGISLSLQIISFWIKEYKKYTPFIRIREFVLNNYSKKDIIEESKLIHQQIYNFRFHKAKIDIILNEELKHFKFKPLKQFLELVIAECPHQLFQNPIKRSSESKQKFNLEQVKITSKNNTAVKIANFVLQAVSNNKLRHEKLQEFMLSNDTVTIATEIPILLNSDDIRHYIHELNFDIPFSLNDNEYLTGHIDLIQIRNGLIYIMDFKPSASKTKPIEQLTIYALALSRLTGLRLYNFRCAWFDSKNYYEFFPLHVVYKKKKSKKLSKEQKKLN